MFRRYRQRLAPAACAPIVFRWDLDKTYLKTEFDSLRELVRLPFEKAQDKIAVPGVVPLIRGLREAAVHAGREVRIYFISASPPQIAKAIRQKLALDGIEYDGIVFKDQLGHLVRGRFRDLREHVGFKLTELLSSRQTLPAAAIEVLFGDDWESDPIIYSLYADIVAGRVEDEELADALRALEVAPALIAGMRELAHKVARADAVVKIYINLERRMPLTSFRIFGPRLVPTFNYLQTAACLLQDGYLPLAGVGQVAERLISESAYTSAAVINSLADITRRGHLQPRSAAAIRAHLRARGLVQLERRSRLVAAWSRLIRWIDPRPRPVSSPPELIDYPQLVTQWQAARLEERR